MVKYFENPERAIILSSNLFLQSKHNTEKTQKRQPLVLTGGRRADGDFNLLHHCIIISCITASFVGIRINSDCNGVANILGKVSSQLKISLAKVRRAALSLQKQYNFDSLSKLYRKQSEELGLNRSEQPLSILVFLKRGKFNYKLLLVGLGV